MRLYVKKLIVLLVLVTIGGPAVFSQAMNEYDVEFCQHPAAAGRCAFSATGCWRGLFAARPGLEIPFDFDIRRGWNGGLELFFRSEDESTEGGKVVQTTDSLVVRLCQSDKELAFHIQGDSLVGVLRRTDGRDQPLVVTATPNTGYRFRSDKTNPTILYLALLPSDKIVFCYLIKPY